MVCRDFILPEPASYVFFYAIFNLRNLLYIITLSGAGVYRNCARAVCRGTKEAGTAAKNVGVEETDPRRPHFCVTEKSAGTGAGDR